MKKKKLFILLSALVLGLSACNAGSSGGQGGSGSEPSGGNEPSGGGTEPGGGGSDPEPEPEPEPTTIHVSSVSLNKSSLELYTDDNAVTLTATVLPDDATDKSVTWSSNNTSAATVNNGVVTPVGKGDAIITVTTVDGNKTAQCNVSVKERVTIPDYVLHGQFNGDTEWTDKQMVINPSSSSEYMIQGVSLYSGDIFKVHMSGDKWYGYSDIKSSVKSGLVTAAPSDGNIKVLTTGVYDIYCSYNLSDGGHIYLSLVDDSSSTPSKVSVTGISLSNSGKFMLVRNEFTITATVYPSNATNEEVKWTSSDTSIATVSAGRVVASVNSKVGSTTITATTVDGGFTATCVVYVSASQYPDYCLTGTINGRSYSGISSRYAAVPLSSGKYLIPDVELKAGDELTVTDNYGARLKNKTNQIYTKSINKDMSVNIYLNVNDANKDYLSLVTKSTN